MKKLTTQEFVDRARAVHGDRYGYAFSVYVSSRDKIMIHCPEHGFFEMTPANHIAGKGCSRCDMRLMQGDVMSGNMDRVTVLIGDCIESMRKMQDKTINCCVTSPPYFGLRDYGMDGQIGLEQRAPEYVSKMVSVFDQVRRVLRDDGVLFVNIGDTYAGFKDGKFPPHSQSNGKQRGMPVSGAPHRCKQMLELDGFRNKS